MLDFEAPARRGRTTQNLHTFAKHSKYNTLAGAALDVFEKQPLSPASPLFFLPNVILSTHLAGITQDSMRRMSKLAAEQVLTLLDGNPPKHFVNVDIKETAISRLLSLGRI